MIVFKLLGISGAYAQQQTLNKGIVVTKDTFSKLTIKNKKIELIPAWLFLLEN